MGLVTVQVGASPVRLDVELLAVDAPSPYNAIMGCTWIHRMRAVPSTYHQRTHFPMSKGVMEVKGDQIISRSGLIAAIKGKSKKGNEEGVCSDEKAEART